MFSRHMFCSRFPPFHFAMFSNFHSLGMAAFDASSSGQVWIPSASRISKKSMRSWNRCWLYVGSFLLKLKLVLPNKKQVASAVDWMKLIDMSLKLTILP